jgi:hypothetical protein
VARHASGEPDAAAAAAAGVAPSLMFFFTDIFADVCRRRLPLDTDGFRFDARLFLSAQTPSAV